MAIKNMKQDSQWAFSVDLPDFEQQVIEASYQQPVLVDLWAGWCPPCLVIAPVLTQLVDESAGELLLAKVEIDQGENMKLAGRYKAKGFPSVILFDQGEERGRFTGAQSLDFIQEFVAEHSLPR